MNTEALLFIVAFIILVILIIAGTTKCLIEKYKQNPEKTNKYIIDSVKAVLFMWLIGAIVVAVVIIFAFDLI